MDDNVKQAASYKLDQDILDARGINMTVEEVAGLSTCKYSERVRSLKLSDNDLVFLKGLRRRIKNRLASQNSRRRSMEQLRRLTRELRVVRACQQDVQLEHTTLMETRSVLLQKCRSLRRHVQEVLQARADSTEIPNLDFDLPLTFESQEKQMKKIVVNETKTPPLSECFTNKMCPDIFKCNIDKLVNQSVDHIFNSDYEKKKVFARTVFISSETSNVNVNVKSVLLSEREVVSRACEQDSGVVLNLSVKEGRRKSHGRKQLAPRRIAYAFTESDNEGVIDLKIKKESQ